MTFVKEINVECLWKNHEMVKNEVNIILLETKNNKLNHFKIV